jgi:aspartate/methionine/tyrosine aminotransferase
LLDLTETNPTKVALAYPSAIAGALADPGVLAYEPEPLGLPSARSAAARECARSGARVEAERIVLTTSTSEAYALLFKLLCDAGDAVLVPHPSYPLFEHLTQLESVTAIPYALEYHGAWRVDVDSITRAATDRVRAILIVSPNNPTGSFLHQDDLDALSNLAASRGWAIIGDEVFADYPLDPAPEATNVLAGADVLTFSLGGLSKAAGLPQLKLGWIGFGGPSSKVDQAVQAAAADLIERGTAIRSQILARVQRNLESLRKLATAHPSVSVLRVEGGWSAVAQVPQLRAEEALVLELLEKDDVLVHPGYFFDFDREAFVVVSLLVEPATFDQAVTRLLARAAGAKS